MNTLAIVDATDIEAPEGPATIVAGLSLVERTARLAAVCGADEIIVVFPDEQTAESTPLDERHVDAPVQYHATGTPPSSVTPPDGIVVLDAGAAYRRSWVADVVDDIPTLETGTWRASPDRRLAVYRPDGPADVADIVAEPTRLRQNAPEGLEGGWIEPVDSAAAARRAERRLWDGCRKDVDGIVSRNFNRYISLSVSRLLAPTSVRPNHVTFLTFALGLAAAAAAISGGYMGFLAAGVLYQINSIVDGIDGELSRVRYEFSVRGEWLDTLSDDMADLSMCIGIGIGAWHTFPETPGPLGSETWLILGGVAALAKLTVMFSYYRVLLTKGRGDVQAIEWSFNRDDDETEDTPVDRLLSKLYYVFRKDFIVFTAMLLAVAGHLPYVLFALAPGYTIVATSVTIQHARDRTRARSSSLDS